MQPINSPDELRQWWNKLNPFWTRILKMRFDSEFEYNKTKRDAYVPTDKDLERLISSTTLKVTGVSVPDLEPLRRFTELTELDISGLQYVTSIEPLRPLKKLKSLTVGINTSDFSVFREFTNLERLVWSGTTFVDLQAITSLQSLKYLWVGTGTLQQLNGIENLINLEELFFFGLTITDFSSLSKLSKLKRLSFERCNILTLEPLQSLHALEELYIDNAPLRSLKGIEDLKQMKLLRATSCEIDDVGILAGFKDLALLNILKTNVKNLKPLQGLQSLKEIHISETRVPKEEMLAFRKAMPQCAIRSEKGAFPFHTFEIYRVKKTFTTRDWTFKEGQVLQYKSSELNHYDGIEICYFVDMDTKKELRWDIWQHELDDWNKYLEVITP